MYYVVRVNRCKAFRELKQDTEMINLNERTISIRVFLFETQNECFNSYDCSKDVLICSSLYSFLLFHSRVIIQRIFSSELILYYLSCELVGIIFNLRNSLYRFTRPFSFLIQANLQ